MGFYCSFFPFFSLSFFASPTVSSVILLLLTSAPPYVRYFFLPSIVRCSIYHIRYVSLPFLYVLVPYVLRFSSLIFLFTSFINPSLGCSSYSSLFLPFPLRFLSITSFASDLSSPCLRLPSILHFSVEPSRHSPSIFFPFLFSLPSLLFFHFLVCRPSIFPICIHPIRHFPFATILSFPVHHIRPFPLRPLPSTLHKIHRFMSLCRKFSQYFFY